MRFSLRTPAFCLIALLAKIVIPHGDAAAQDIEASDVDAVFSDISEGMPGCAVGVYAAGDVLYSNGYGTANLDYGLPITPQSVFYLGSVGKQFTTSAVVHAANAGHLSLDDPVQKWIPEIPEYDTPVTVRRMVHHTSGIRDYLTLLGLAGIPLDMPMSDQDVVDLIGQQEALNFPAGDRYLYSNSGYFLLAEIVKRATGSSLREYLERHFFEPLGMNHTRAHDNRTEVMPNRVVAYRESDGEYWMDHPWSFDKVGSGGVWSSIDDLAHWDRNWYTEEAGGPGFSDQLSQPGVLNDGTELTYAFGIDVDEYRGARIVEHGGALAGFRSQLLRFPELERTVMVACSFPTSDPGGRAYRIADALLADRLDPVVAEDGAEERPTTEAELSPEQLDRFTGHWRASMGVEISIERRDDGLVLIQNGPARPLIVRSETQLALPAVQLEMTFSQLANGRYHHQDVRQAGQTFTASRFDPGNAPDLSEYVGTYYAPELDVEWEVGIDDTRLRISLRNGSRPAQVVGPDMIVAPGLQLHIVRTAGEVTGFRVDAGRALGIRFERREGMD